MHAHGLGLLDLHVCFIYQLTNSLCRCCTAAHARARHLGCSSYMFVLVPTLTADAILRHMHAHGLGLLELHVSYISSPTPLCRCRIAAHVRFIYQLANSLCRCILRHMHAHGLRLLDLYVCFIYQLANSLCRCRTATHACARPQGSSSYMFVSIPTLIADAVLQPMHAHGLKLLDQHVCFIYQLINSHCRCCTAAHVRARPQGSSSYMFVSVPTLTADAVLQPMHAHSLKLLDQHVCFIYQLINSHCRCHTAAHARTWPRASQSSHASRLCVPHHHRTKQLHGCCMHEHWQHCVHRPHTQRCC